MITAFKRYFLLPFIFAGLIPARGTAQANESSVLLPPAYYNLTSDTARMRFLLKAVSDSLNSGQLNLIYNMAQKGIVLAKKNNVDTMKGIFYFDLAKSFAYKYNKPDSAIFYYRKVLPYFTDKLGYYNIISVREIMQAYLGKDKKDSVFAYLDTLHERIDTMLITNPRRYGLSSVMAGVYQYYGMFKTAIALYKNSIEGIRKAGFLRSAGLPMANLAELYDESEDDINAVRYAREALGYLRGSNMPFMGTASNLSVYYSNLNRLDSALYFNHLSDSVATLIHNEGQMYIYNPLNYVNILSLKKNTVRQEMRLIR